MPASIPKRCCLTRSEPAERFPAQVCEHCGETEQSQNDVPPARCFSHLLVLLQVHADPLQRSLFQRANFILPGRHEMD
ncbi:uncharacterized [Tachysurus ichikawai]